MGDNKSGTRYNYKSSMLLKKPLVQKQTTSVRPKHSTMVYLKHTYFSLPVKQAPTAQALLKF